MTGLLADTYGLVLVVHLSALLGAISAGALAHYSEARLRTAETLAGIRTSVAVLSKVEKAFPIALALLVGTGAYLVQRGWTWRSGWIEASLGAVVILLLNGALVVEGRSRARRDELTRTHGDRAAARVVALTGKHVATVASWLNTGVALGIVFVMTTKPHPAPSIAALLIAASGGATVGLRLRGKGARND